MPRLRIFSDAGADPDVEGHDSEQTGSGAKAAGARADYDIRCARDKV